MHSWLSAEDEAVRVALVAADPLASAGLASLLADQPGCRVVAQLTSLDDLPLVEDADVVLWDAAGEDRGATGLEDISRPILALLPDGEPYADLLRRGVRGVLDRHTSGDRLAAALAALAQGLLVLEPDRVPPDAASGAPEPPLEDLTPRELEVLQLLAEGLSNKRIARGLDISEHTVKFHVNAILGKLGAASRTEAVMRAVRLGLIVV